METRQIRLENLMELSRQFKRTADFCEKIEMSTSYYSQVKTGKKAIGDEVARRTERLLGIPKGFMDSLKNESKNNTAMPTDVLGLAFAIKSMPHGVKESFKNLVYNVIAVLSSGTTAEKSEKKVEPFSLEFKRTEDAGQRNNIPKKEAQQ